MDPELQQVCMQHGIFYAKVETVQDALQQRDISSSLTSGVWLVSSDFRRGLDLKLAADSTVLIIDMDRSLNWTDACQMVGRSSRAQGICMGYVWLCGGQEHASSVSITQVLQ